MLLYLARVFGKSKRSSASALQAVARLSKGWCKVGHSEEESAGEGCAPSCAKHRKNLVLYVIVVYPSSRPYLAGGGSSPLELCYKYTSARFIYSQCIVLKNECISCACTNHMHKSRDACMPTCPPDNFFLDMALLIHATFSE